MNGVTRAIRDNVTLVLAACSMIVVVILWSLSSLSSTGAAVITTMIALVATLVLANRANELAVKSSTLSERALAASTAPLLKASFSEFEALGDQPGLNRKVEMTLSNVGAGYANDIQIELDDPRNILFIRDIDAPDALAPQESVKVPIEHRFYYDVISDPRNLIDGKDYIDRATLEQPKAFDDATVLVRYRGSHNDLKTLKISFETIKARVDSPDKRFRVIASESGASEKTSERSIGKVVEFL